MSNGGVELPGELGLAVLLAEVGPHQFVSHEKEHYEAQCHQGQPQLA